MDHFLGLIIPVSLVLIASCPTDADNTPTPTPVSQLVPLKVGNTWTYKLSLLDSSGVLVRTWDSTFTISHDSLIGQTPWYLFANEEWGSTGRGPLYAITDSGLVSDFPRFRLIYRTGSHAIYHTTELDSAVLGPDSIPGTRFFHYLEVWLWGVHPQVDVEAGSFVCNGYTFCRGTCFFNDFPDHLDYVAPGVGLIKRASYTYRRLDEQPYTKLMQTQTYELKSYQLQ